MRILFLTDDYPPQRGGVSTWTHAAVHALGTHAEVRVIARARGDRGSVPGVFEARGRSFGRWGGVWTARAALPLLDWAELVIASTWPVATVLAPWLRRRGVPLHVIFHGSDLTCPPTRSGFKRVTSGARCWAVSDFLVSQARARGLSAVRLPCPLPLCEPVEEPGERWLMIARATPLKGGERFIRLVAAADRDADLIGHGPELARWRRLAIRIGARVRFHGAQDSQAVDALIRESGLVVLLPRSDAGAGAEGLGLVLMEARARGIGVVGCRTGGVAEAVGPGLLLDDPDDAIRSAEAIEAWCTPGVGRRGWQAYRETEGPEAFVHALSATFPRPLAAPRGGRRPPLGQAFAGALGR